MVNENRFEVSSIIFNKWLSIRQRNQSLEKYFEDNFIDCVAIYGIGALGQRLIDELENTRVEVKFGIDRNNANKKNSKIKILGITELTYESIGGIDAIIVTPVQDYWNIVFDLEKFVDCPILSLEDVVDYCVEQVN